MVKLNGALQPKSDVYSVYVARQKGRRGFISCVMCVNAEENNLAWYVRNSNEKVMAVVRKIKILDSEGQRKRIHLKEVGRMPAYCMVNFCGKCQRQLTKIRPGSRLGKET